MFEESEINGPVRLPNFIFLNRLTEFSKILNGFFQFGYKRASLVQDIWNKTWYPKAADHVNTEKTWYIVDATDKILGRLASTIAIHIRGKNLATYTPSVDMGAYVIVVCCFSLSFATYSLVELDGLTVQFHYFGRFFWLFDACLCL